MLNCRDAARLLSERCDHRLSWRARIRLRMHLWACRMCQVYGAQLSAVSRVCNEAGVRAEDHCPECMPDERKRRIKDAIEREPR